MKRLVVLSMLIAFFGLSAITSAAEVDNLDPQARIMINSAATDKDYEEGMAMDKYTDVWMPHYRAYKDKDIARFIQSMRNSKKQLWSYYYCEGPSEKAQHPGERYLKKFMSGVRASWKVRSNLLI